MKKKNPLTIDSFDTRLKIKTKVSESCYGSVIFRNSKK